MTVYKVQPWSRTMIQIICQQQTWTGYLKSAGWSNYMYILIMVILVTLFCSLNRRFAKKPQGNIEYGKWESIIKYSMRHICWQQGRLLRAIHNGQISRDFVCNSCKYEKCILHLHLLCPRWLVKRTATHTHMPCEWMYRRFGRVESWHATGNPQT